jgi:hypothetical protein
MLINPCRQLTLLCCAYIPFCTHIFTLRRLSQRRMTAYHHCPCSLHTQTAHSYWTAARSCESAKISWCLCFCVRCGCTLAVHECECFILVKVLGGILSRCLVVSHLTLLATTCTLPCAMCLGLCGMVARPIVRCGLEPSRWLGKCSEPYPDRHGSLR